MYDGMFMLGTDYKTALAEEIDKLIALDIVDDSMRIRMVHEITEAYWNQTEKKPDSLQLAKLTNWILDEERNSHPDKVTNTEYPILTGYQMKVRQRREYANEHIETFTSSGQHRVSGKKKPKQFKVFGEYT